MPFQKAIQPVLTSHTSFGIKWIFNIVFLANSKASMRSSLPVIPKSLACIDFMCSTNSSSCCLEKTVLKCPSCFLAQSFSESVSSSSVSRAFLTRRSMILELHKRPRPLKAMWPMSTDLTAFRMFSSSHFCRSVFLT